MITKIGNPKYELMPSYNPVVWFFKSDKVDNPKYSNFRYYIDVVDTDTNKVIFSKTIMPDFVDGKAGVHLDRELSDFVSYDLDLDKFNSAPYDATKSYLKYKLEVGEEYVEHEIWYFNVINTSPNGYIRFTATDSGGVITPPFTVGEDIKVNFEEPINVLSQPLIGLYEVKQIVITSSDSKGVETTMKLAISPQIENGWIVDTNTKRTRVRKLYTSDEQIVFNGVFNQAGWLDYNMNDYLFHVTYNKEINFLSVLPRSYKLRTKNHLFVNYFKWDRTSTAPKFIDFTNDTGTTRRLTLTNNTAEYVMQVNIGTSRLNFGTHTTGPNAALLTSTTKWYDVNFKSENGTAHFDVPYRIYVDDSCAPDKEYIEMLFLDKLGSILPYNFLFKHKESHKIDRSNFTKNLGGYNGTSEFTYDLVNGGEITYNAAYGRSFILKTEFLNDEESRFFQHIAHSPVTVIKVDGKYQRCVIKTTNIEIKKGKQSALKRYEIQVELSNRDKLNI